MNFVSRYFAQANCSSNPRHHPEPAGLASVPVTISLTVVDEVRERGELLDSKQQQDQHNDNGNSHLLTMNAKCDPSEGLCYADK